MIFTQEKMWVVKNGEGIIEMKPRERDDLLTGHHENVDYAFIKRKKDEVRGKTDKQDTMHAYRASEDQRKEKGVKSKIIEKKIVIVRGIKLMLLSTKMIDTNSGEGGQEADLSNLIKVYQSTTKEKRVSVH